MDTSAIDFGALASGLLGAAFITAALAWAARSDRWWRIWAVALAVTVILVAIGLWDLMRDPNRETHLATHLIGIPLTVLGTVGMLRATRRVRPWLRWVVVLLTAFVLLFSGLLFGAAIAPRFLGS